MTTPLNFLLIEDNDDDALLVIRQLHVGGFEPHYKQICTRAELLESLDELPWDIVLSDYSMGQFTGLDALRLIRQKGLDVPFIVVSGTIGEDVAVQTMKAGANDYLMKQNLTRLVPAVRRELAEAQTRKEKKNAERERELLLTALQQRTNDLQSIVSISSHDLRSPLVNIQGFAGELRLACQQIMQLMEEENADYPSKQKIKTVIEKDILPSLHYIQSNTDKMDSLVAGLFKFSQLGTVVPMIGTVDMNHVVQHVLQSIGYQIRKYNISVACQTLPSCLGETTLLDQVFTNLIDNAIKYRHPDRPLRLEIGATMDAEHCHYRISDNGIGIAAEYRERIFEIFHKLHPNTNGIGLGLTIVKTIVNRLHGTISVESQVGQGSTFTISLPKA